MPEHAPILPVIAAEVAALAPGFRALSLTVEAAPIVRPEIAGRAVERACQALARGEPDWAEAHLAAWAEAFRRFGAKPQRTPCSAEALRKRALRGLLRTRLISGADHDAVTCHSKPERDPIAHIAGAADYCNFHNNTFFPTIT